MIKFLVENINIVIFAIIFPILFRYLRSQEKKLPTISGNTFILTNSSLYGKVGWLGFCLAAFFGILVTFFLETSISDLMWLLIFFLTGFFLILYARIKVAVSDTAIRYHGLFSNIKELQWNNVAKITTSSIGFIQEIKLSDNTTIIKIPSTMTGFDHFVEVMNQKISKEKRTS